MQTKRWMLAPAAIVLAMTACTCNETAGTALDQDVARAQQWSLAPGGRLVKSSRPSRSRSSFEVTWEIESDESWPRYRAALEQAMPRGYAAVSGSPRGASFKKLLAGDTHYLQVEVIADGPPLRIAVTFAAQAG